MKYLKIAACLVALIFSFSSMALGAELYLLGGAGKMEEGQQGSQG